jgi:RNA polymerase sigma-70 factor (ECF subfamily)
MRIPTVIATLPEPTSLPTTRGWSRTAELVVLAQDGDREAFGALIEHFQPTVYALCRSRLGNPSEAADLTQEVFLHVMRRIGQLREPERFAGWLKQVTVRMAINRATRRVPPPSLDRELLEGAAGPRDEPIEQLIGRERARLLWEGLARLSPMDRDTLVAFYIDGMSIVEVAEEHDVPIGTVKRRLHTARKRLRSLLQDAHDDWSDEAEQEDEAEPAINEGLALATV